MEFIFSDTTQFVLIAAWIVYLTVFAVLYGMSAAEGPTSRVARFTCSVAADMKSAGECMLGLCVIWLAFTFQFVALGAMAVGHLVAAAVACAVIVVLILPGLVLPHTPLARH